MAKQVLNIGNKVDDGTGDYLRKGGIKIKGNFDEIYNELGDTSNLHPAGSWKTHKTSDGATITLKFGSLTAIDSRGGQVRVTLPKGNSSRFNQVVKIRDVWQSWARSPVIVSASTGDTIKGSAKPVKFSTNFMDLEFVYCAPGRWEYVNNKRVDRIDTSDLSTVARKEFIVEKDGQTDFLNVFGSDMYNTNNTTVHWRGNLLTYGDSYKEGFSDFGSPGKKAGEVVALDGYNIRLKVPTKAGDSVTITSYIDGIATWRSTYERSSIRVVDPNLSSEASVPGKVWVMGDATEIPMSAFGVRLVDINPNSIEVLVNGVILTRVGEVGTTINDANTLDVVTHPANMPIDRNDLYSGYCTINSLTSKADCLAAGGKWYYGIGDYTFTFDTDSNVQSILLNEPIEDGDVVSIRWFNNNIGTTMELIDILAKTDVRYVATNSGVKLTNMIEYTKFVSNPKATDVRKAPDIQLDSVSSVTHLIDMLYPIGTVYENAHNKANPRDYMGFGTWVRYAEGSVTAGWDSNPANGEFHLNPDIPLTSQGSMTAAAGFTFGTNSTLLNSKNIPNLTSQEIALVKDENGNVIIGGCIETPENPNGPGYRLYSERNITHKVAEVDKISNIQRTITTYKWLRVA